MLLKTSFHVGLSQVRLIYRAESIVSSLFLCHRYIQGASSPKDMVILVDV